MTVSDGALAADVGTTVKLQLFRSLTHLTT